MLKTLFSAFVVITLSSCATIYQSKSLTGGYSSIQLGKNIFNVRFAGNGYTSRERAQDFALLRSAELIIENGYKYFIIVDTKQHTENSTYTYGSGYSYGNNTTYNTNTYGTANTTFSGGKTYHISKPRASNVIMGFTEKPNIDGIVYEANFVIKSIKSKYAIQ